MLGIKIIIIKKKLSETIIDQKKIDICLGF